MTQSIFCGLTKDAMIVSGVMPIPSEKICECVRCGYAWVKRVDARPVRCPKCKQPNWDVPVGKIKMGRPKKKAEAPKRVKRSR